MGASFRNTDEILQLAGCDRLTISPNLLDELTSATGDVPKHLDASVSKTMDVPKIEVNENTFRWMMNEDPMATEKLAESVNLLSIVCNCVNCMLTNEKIII